MHVNCADFVHKAMRELIQVLYRCECNHAWLEHLLKNYVKELLYRKKERLLHGHSMETRPKLLILRTVLLEEFSITKPSESKMSSMIV